MTIPFEKTIFFSKIIIDYLNQSESVSKLYNNFPTIQNFKHQIDCKKKSIVNRGVLVNSLTNQYKNVNISKKTYQNITSLLDENTFTVTTGHQLNLFTGPLYFLYKIISTINLCEELSVNFPEYNFVPIYWMATEDHDFEEINFFNFKEKKIQWNSYEKGAVGRFSTQGLKTVFDIFSSELNQSEISKELKSLFQKAYLEHENLSEATRYLVNELFAEYGLVILDADEKELKHEFFPYLKQELLQQTSFKEVSKTIDGLKKNYKVQVNPREINLFYLVEGLRERIILEDDIYKVNNSEISFTKEGVLKELELYPERFSPNVIMRPLYQEVILPNLCYIGGAGELAYWFELKRYFEAVNVAFPVLLLRNSVQLISKKQVEKLKKLRISNEELFLKQNDLLNIKVQQNSMSSIDFSQQKVFLKQQFLTLKEVALKTDKSFLGAVNAQEKKQLKGLDNLEKRWLRAEKRNQQELVNRIIKIQNELFPNQRLEERKRNFSEFYQQYGKDFIKVLKKRLNPLKMEFILLEL